MWRAKLSFFVTSVTLLPYLALYLCYSVISAISLPLLPWLLCYLCYIVTLFLCYFVTSTTLLSCFLVTSYLTSYFNVRCKRLPHPQRRLWRLASNSFPKRTYIDLPEQAPQKKAFKTRYYTIQNKSRRERVPRNSILDNNRRKTLAKHAYFAFRHT